MPCCERMPARIVLGMMIFWSALSAFLLRMNLSLAIVAMVGTKPRDSMTSTSFNASGCVRVAPDNITLQATLDQQKEGDFDWSESTQGTILSAFFWGYLVLQMPGGRLAEIIGGRRVLGTAILVASLLSAITPPLARLHYGFLVAVRVMQGLCLGVQFPTVTALITRWVPVQERARFTSTFLMGGTLGLSLLMPFCGLVIDQFGWPALFYMSAGQGVLFCVCWFLLVHDEPDKHPRISNTEKHHIHRGLVGNVQTIPVPWRAIFTSMQFWCSFLTSMGSDWGFYTILTLGPKYMASILGVNMKQNGLLSALPFLCRYSNGVLVAQVLDFCLRRKYITLINMRRCAATISHVLPAIALVAFPLAGCDIIPAVTLLCLAMGLNGALTSGHGQASMDMAPNFAGTLSGLKNGLCSVTGILSPIIIGMILENDASVSGWIMAFTLSAGIYASSSLLYFCFFTAQVETWNNRIVKEEAQQPMRPKIVKTTI